MEPKNANPKCAIIHNHPIHYKHLLFKALAENELDFVVLFTSAFSRDRLEKPLPEAEEYRYRIGFEGSYEGVQPSTAAKFVWNSLRELRPAAVIISGYYDAAAWTAWTWARLHGVRRILWAESNEFDHPRHPIREWPKRLFVKNCHLAHVYGQSSAAYIEKLGMPRANIYVKRAVADTDRFLAKAGAERRTTGPIRLLYVGRLAKEKNLELVLRALAALEQDKGNPRLVLSLVGYGPLERELRRLTSDLGLSNIVQFPGKALQAELPDVYNKADAFILPSTYEPWGLVANEAMLCSLPVLLSTQCGCTADLWTPSTGWKFAPGDQSALTRLLKLVAATPREKLREMGREATQVAAAYSPENCARVVSESIQRVISKSAPNRH